MSAALVELFGPELQGKDGKVSTAIALEGKTAIGIYFSAHWCPPCRGFTPKLAEMYTNAFKAKGMEIVFASSDRDAKSFDEYYGEQPWLALPFDEDEIKDKLSSKYKVSGIPSFVILDQDGKTITTEGQRAVSSDPTGEKYPWVPPTKEEKGQMTLALLDGLVDKSGATYGKEKLAGKAIGLYFSAHWCPPCRAFTPTLAKYYEEGLKDKMELVFVSSDRDKDQYQEYLNEMPWLALPFDKRKQKEELSEIFGVEGIPSFCIIDENGMLITDNGRSKVEEDPKGDTFPAGWFPQPLSDVNDDPSKLNSDVCLVVYQPDETGKAALNTLAQSYRSEAGGEIDDMKYQFFYATTGGVEGQIRKLTKTVDAPNNTMIILDLGAGGKFYRSEALFTDEASVKAFLDAYSSKSLEAQQVG